MEAADAMVVVFVMLLVWKPNSNVLGVWQGNLCVGINVCVAKMLRLVMTSMKFPFRHVLLVLWSNLLHTLRVMLIHYLAALTCQAASFGVRSYLESFQALGLVGAEHSLPLAFPLAQVPFVNSSKSITNALSMMGALD